jgi:hypothetical protein
LKKLNIIRYKGKSQGHYLEVLGHNEEVELKNLSSE